MIEWKEKLQQLQNWIQDDKRVKWIVIIGLSAILVLFVWGLFPSSERPVTEPQSQSLDDYQQALQEQTALLLQQIEGVGTLSVMITLEGDYQVIYQTDESNKTEETTGDDEQKRITETTQNVVYEGDIALVQTTATPRVLGVAVVCQGGDQIAVQQRVIDVVTTLFDLSTTKVTVVAGYLESQK